MESVMTDEIWSIQVRTISPKSNFEKKIPVVHLVINSDLDAKAAKELGELLIDIAGKL